jgi:hypothetical protein
VRLAVFLPPFWPVTLLLRCGEKGMVGGPYVSGCITRIGPYYSNYQRTALLVQQWPKGG